jgi:hypothetical protein
MRRAAKVDRNQPEIVRALRQAGASVQCLHTIGQGCPDLLVYARGDLRLMEIKDGLQPPSGQKLTHDEQMWHMLWRGPVHIVTSVEEALNALK